MPSDDDVRLLGRSLLGRDLTEGEIAWHLQLSPSLDFSRTIIVQSQEFTSRWFPGPAYAPETSPPGLRKPPGQSMAVVAIVKDEADIVAEMLRSVAPVADFFAIADTGSTDGTQALVGDTLRDLGAAHRLASIAFHDFSQARNEALALVPDEVAWILVLDADERLVAEDHQRLLDLLAGPFDAYKLPRYNFNDLAKAKPPHPYPDHQRRLFRNRPSDPVRYVGKVHEFPVGYDRWRAAPTSDAHHDGPTGGPHIHHIGQALTAADRQRNKHELYGRLTQSEVVESSKAPPEAVPVPSHPSEPPMSINPQDYAGKFYSQCGEDIFLSNNIIGTRPNGFYVDVGAHHPYRISNTALFHERGWRGINIDVDQRAISAFEQCRPNDVNVLCGVAGKAGELTLNLFNEGAVNTLSTELAEEYSRMPGREIIERYTVEVRTLAQILDEHLPAGQSIDIMSVDVEGLDEEVLRSNNWDRYRPLALLVETHGASFATVREHPVSLYLAEQGYQIEGITGLTTIFRRLR